MARQGKTRLQLLAELNEMQERINELETLRSGFKLALEELENSETLLRKVFMTIPDLVAIIDRDHRILLSNWHGGYQYVPEGYRGGTPICFKAYYDRESPCEPCHVVEVFRTGKPVTWEKVNPRIGQVEIRAYPIFDESGSVRLVIENIRDITKRKQAEEALEKSSKEYCDLYNHAPCGYHSLDRNGIYIQINDTELQWLGYTRDEIIRGKRFSDLVTPECKAVFEANFPILQERGWIRDLEFEMVRKNGTTFPVLLSSTAIRDDNGNFLMTRSILYDITERKQAEQELCLHREHLEELVRERTAELCQTNESLKNEIIERRQVEESLRESEEKFRVLAETSHAMIFLYQGENHIYVNPAAELLTGYTKEEFLDMRLWDWLSEEFKELVKYRALARQHGITVPTRYEFRFVSKEGEARWGLLSAGIIDYRGKTTGIGTIIDITELKQAESKLSRMNEELIETNRQLMEAHEELVRKEKVVLVGQLAACVGHELRNPLGVVKNAAFFLKSILPDANETVLEYLDIIKEEIDNSQSIISDLLDYSRSRTPHRISTPVHELSINVLERCHIPDNITLRTDVPETLPPVTVDSLQIKQVLQNLILNGIQAMPSGGTLQLAARQVTKFLHPGSATDTEPSGDFVEISITDTGEGISPENIKKLFQPLFTTKARGIGLGLTICKNHTEANGGKIMVASESGKGSTFTIQLPVGK